MKIIVALTILFMYSAISFAQVEAKNGIDQVNQKRQTNVYYDAEQNKYYIDDITVLSFGGYGSTLITGTTTAVGNYFALQILEDAVIDSLVDAGRDGDAVNSLALTAGIIIYGQNITRIKLVSGTAMAYKRKVQ